MNKQDSDNPLYRSRLVAKDFNNYKDPELYTATPPLEILRLIVSIAASSTSKRGRKWKIMVNDVSRAYFYAESLKPTFVEICPRISKKVTRRSVESFSCRCTALGQLLATGSGAIRSCL